MKEGIIDGDTTSGGGVKDSEFRVFDSSSEEIGNGVCTGMKGDGVEGGVF